MIWTVRPTIHTETLDSGLYSTLTLLFISKVVLGGNEIISSFAPESKTIIFPHPSKPVKSCTIPVASMPELSFVFVHPLKKRKVENKMI